jgi:hypothetical protein
MSLWVVNNESENKFIPDAFSSGVDNILQKIKNFSLHVYNNFIKFVKSIKNKFIKNDESNK